MSIDEIRRRAGKFQEQVYWRNAREYAAGLATVLFSGVGFWLTSDTLMRVSLGLIIGGMVYMMWHLHRRGSSRSLPEDFGLATGIEFYRRELGRQRDLLQGVWKWYLGPIILPFMAFFLVLARTSSGHLGHMGPRLALFAAIAIVVWWLNYRGARKLQARIEELDALHKPE
jgi:hypothetical protein